MISLIVLTYRPGGMDLLADSLALTMPGKGSWELVLIDDCPGRVQRGLVPPYFRERGVPLGYYGYSKPKQFPDTKGSLVNAANTALMHACGDFLVWVSDYTLLPRYWLWQWEYFRELHRGDRPWSMSGCAMEYFAPKPPDPEDIRTWPEVLPVHQTYGAPLLAGKKCWVPQDFETFYYGAETELFLQMNGLDERADHCHCWPLSSFVAQMRMMGVSLLVNQELTCYMIDHRVWDDPQNREPAPPGCGGEGMWRITELASVPEEPVWQVPSPNPFDLRVVRRANGAGW